MTRFIQICASQNDLFALDEDGDVYQYRFNTSTWVKLVASRADEAPRPRAPAPGDRGSLDAR